MNVVPKKSRETVDDIVRREAPGYVISKPTQNDRQLQAKPDAVVPPIAAMQKPARRGPGADASHSTPRIARKRDTEVRLIAPKDGNADAGVRAMGPKAVIVSKSQRKIVSRQG